MLSVHGKEYKNFDSSIIVLNSQVTYNSFDVILLSSSPSFNGVFSKKIFQRLFGLQSSSPLSLA
jgi:hypothetical protein